MTHACRKCDDQFEPTSRQVRGHDWICNPCSAAYQRARYAAHPDQANTYRKAYRAKHPGASKAYYRAYDARPDVRARHAEAWRKWYGTSAGREHVRESNRAWRENNKDKERAHNKVRTAVRNGTLIPLPCENCGGKKSGGHHEDYSQPLIVTWLCGSCHGQLHSYKQDVLTKKAS